MVSRPASSGGVSVSDAPTTRKCQSCGEWYDARAPACYICGAEDREYNHALKKAVETSRLNGALSGQMQYANAEARAEQTLRAAKSGGSDSFARARPNVRGYNDLVQGIKNSLENHPNVTDYFG